VKSKAKRKFWKQKVKSINYKYGNPH
jgi:hypothetical protein